MSRWLFALILSASTILLNPISLAEELLPKELAGVGIEEHLGKPLDKSLTFFDHTGKTVKLGDYFDGKTPVILTLNYYRCATLCSLQLNALASSIRELSWKVGEKYRIVTVSFDPNDTMETASDKRDAYLKFVGKGDLDWQFLVGHEAEIKSLTESVGFTYKYNENDNQFAHGAAIYFISGEGIISRYLYGLQYAPMDMKFALIDASEGKVGNTLEKFVLSCFKYDSTHGAYGPFAMGVMRAGGVCTAGFLSLWLMTLWRRDKRRGISGDIV